MNLDRHIEREPSIMSAKLLFPERVAHSPTLVKAPTIPLSAAKSSPTTSLPLAAWVVTSGFGLRFHPILRTVRSHDGVDLAAPIGTPIFAAQNGQVRAAGWQGGYGLFVGLDHGTGLETRYGHMSRLAVTTGQQVHKGEIIGYVGSTGLSTGPHLHYEVRLNGQPVNPMWNKVNLDAPRPFFFSGIHGTSPVPTRAIGQTVHAARAELESKPPRLTTQIGEPDLTIPKQSAGESTALDKSLFLGVDEAGASGRWAIESLRMCSGQKSCRVLAYGSIGLIERNRTRESKNRDRPLLIFLRDAASGMEIALWDCNRVERPSAEQCMPAGEAELRQLMGN